LGKKHEQAVKALVKMRIFFRLQELKTQV